MLFGVYRIIVDLYKFQQLVLLKKNKSRSEERLGGFIMWVCHSPIGTIKIKYDHEVKKYALWLGDECGGYYPSAEAAADDVYTQTSGIDAIDYLKDSRSAILPHDLGDWDKVPD